MMNAVKILKWFYCTCVVIFFGKLNFVILFVFFSYTYEYTYVLTFEMFILRKHFYYVFAAGGNRAEDCDTESTAGKTAAVRLSNELLCGYNKNVRPVKNQTTQTVVNTTLFFMHIDMVSSGVENSYFLKNQSIY